jgi:hypothetical protein
MTRDQLWTIYTTKNPQFLDSGATFTAAGLKKFFDQTWDQAHDQGVKNGKALSQKDSSSPAMDIFKEVFGSK